MSIFKDASDSIMKYGEMIVNKTEEYSKIAKLNVEIKKLDWDIDKVYKEVGKIVIAKMKENVSEISASNDDLQAMYTKFNDLQNLKKQKKDDIKNIRDSKAEKKKSNDSDSDTSA